VPSIMCAGSLIVCKLFGALLYHGWIAFAMSSSGEVCIKGYGQIRYMKRSHGDFYSAAAVKALQESGLPDFEGNGPYYPPVPTCALGKSFEVLDFGQGVVASGHIEGSSAVGKWNEVRENMYGSDSQATDVRDLHIGVDLCGPVGASIHAFADGSIFLVGNYPGQYDYGNVIITSHMIGDRQVWALHGHLSASSIASVTQACPFRKVTSLDGWVTSMRTVNGSPMFISS